MPIQTLLGEGVGPKKFKNRIKRLHGPLRSKKYIFFFFNFIV